MPEGPEIFRESQKLSKVLKGRLLDQVYFKFEELKIFEHKFIKKEVLKVYCKSKAMLIDIEGGDTLYSHNQLYGRWYTNMRGTTPKTSRDLRVCLASGKNAAFLYSASDIEVIKTAKVDKHHYIAKLGPDLFNEEKSRREISKHLTQRKFQGRKLSTLLLDQSFIAGIGNYLRSEILFVERLHFASKLKILDDKEQFKLYETACFLGQQSASSGGITNDLDLANDMKKEGHTRRDYRHWVFGRSGKPCFICGTTIIKTVDGGRRIYICPKCQSFS